MAHTAPGGQPPSQLVKHFQNRSRADQISGWSQLWDADRADMWDRGKPSPALVELVESKAHLLPQSVPGKRLKALVPGCGRGYDVVMLALHGFDAYGLEVSETAINAANAYAQSQMASPQEFNYMNEGNRPTVPAGTVKFVLGDFFTRGWENQVDTDVVSRGFDLVYDYTFLCAILPEMRLEWARRMKQLQSSDGVIVCLEFPLYKDVDAPGPPYGLSGVHWDLLAEGGNGFVGEMTPGKAVDRVATDEMRLKRIAYYKPDTSYESGKGTDMISVWARSEGEAATQRDTGF